RTTTVPDCGAAHLEKPARPQVPGVASPAYMSPEQVKNEEIDYRADMFSLGGVLYHLLTGTRPFDGRTTYELIENIVNGGVQPPSERRHDVPRELDDVVKRALGKAR